MMIDDNESKKKEGERILGNYKKQLAEKMAREKANKGEMSIKSSAKGSAKSPMSKKRARIDEDDDEGFSKIGTDFGGNEPPEPEILLSILHRKGKS